MATLSKQSSVALDRISHVVTSLRVFARLDRSAEDVVDIREGLEVAATLLESQVKDRITIRRDYGEIPPVLCHPGELNQVFMNLLVNASQSIDGTGDIHVRTRFRNGCILVEIADTGAGISPENLQRIFDPGFTTKGVRVGTGLGLATVRRIVEEHGGEVSVESEPGAGATFRVHIPLRSAGE
jgi:signal transduction histidine kinase